MSLHVCEIIGIAAHPDYIDHTPMEPRRFFLRNGVPHELTDLGVEAMSANDMFRRASELEVAENYFRRAGWIAAAKIWATWRHELAAVWREYSSQGERA